MSSLVSKLSLGIIGIVAIIGGVGSGMAASMAVAEGKLTNDEASDGEVDPELAPRFIQMDTLVINLADAGGGRLLRPKLTVEATPAAADRFEQLTPRIRDDVIRVVNDWTYEDIDGANGKNSLRTVLQGRIDDILEPEAIESLLYSDFVVH